jgi:hypothetical protein
MIRSGLALLAAAMLLTGAAGAQGLDGWQGFKFGMGPDQARKVPGFEFGRYSRKNLMDENQGAMASKKPALINGVPYKFDLWFNAFEHLYEINLQNQKTTSRAACEATFLAALATSEKTYGEFAPVYSERKKNDQDVMPLSIEWRASGKSRYQLATAYLGLETASVWDARKVYGPRRYLDIAAVWSAGRDDAQAVCLTQLDYRG